MPEEMTFAVHSPGEVVVTCDEHGLMRRYMVNTEGQFVLLTPGGSRT